MSESKPYGYFDTPEGEDIFKKLFVALKPAGLTGVALSTIDVMCYAHKRTYLQIAGRYAYITLPILGMASAFVITSNLAVNYRHKDDKLNWVIGAVSAGGIMGAWQGSVVGGVTAAVGFAGVAVLKKHCVQNDWNILPKQKCAHGGLHAPRYDFTLTQERPRDWKTTVPGWSHIPERE